MKRIGYFVPSHFFMPFHHAIVLFGYDFTGRLFDGDGWWLVLFVIVVIIVIVVIVFHVHVCFRFCVRVLVMSGTSTNTSSNTGSFLRQSIFHELGTLSQGKTGLKLIEYPLRDSNGSLREEVGLIMFILGLFVLGPSNGSGYKVDFLAFLLVLNVEKSKFENGAEGDVGNDGGREVDDAVESDADAPLLVG